jgi:hypothetical protein
VTAAERLRRRADEFELRAVNYSERAELDDRYAPMTDSCRLLAIALRIVAEELELDEELAA